MTHSIHDTALDELKEMLKVAIPPKQLQADVRSPESRMLAAKPTMNKLKSDPRHSGRLHELMDMLVNPGSRSDRCKESAIMDAMVRYGREIGLIADPNKVADTAKAEVFA